MQMFSFPAQWVLCIQEEGMEVYCKLGLGGLSLSSNIMTKTCPKEGPCGTALAGHHVEGWRSPACPSEASRRLATGLALWPPVLPPCAVGHLKLQATLSFRPRARRPLGRAGSQPCWV